MTRMTVPDCAVMCDLIQTHTHAHSLVNIGISLHTSENKITSQPQTEFGGLYKVLRHVQVYSPTLVVLRRVSNGISHRHPGVVDGDSPAALNIGFPDTCNTE